VSPFPSASLVQFARASLLQLLHGMVSSTDVNLNEAQSFVAPLACSFGVRYSIGSQSWLVVCGDPPGYHVRLALFLPCILPCLNDSLQAMGRQVHTGRSWLPQLTPCAVSCCQLFMYFRYNRQSDALWLKSFVRPPSSFGQPVVSVFSPLLGVIRMAHRHRASNPMLHLW
jgi:hypothetical protein